MNNIDPLTNPNEISINGPVNILRLEGVVHGIKKVIYLFMDFHQNITSQTQCKNIFSEDIQKYFVNSFYKLNKNQTMYDFFVEIYPTEIGNMIKQPLQEDYKEKYIDEVVKFFGKIFNYDPKKNKVSVNKLFKNIRLHYIDIRDYYKHNLQAKISIMSNISREFMCTENINLNDLDNIIYLMELMKKHLELIINILSKSKNKISKPTLIKENIDNSIDLDVIEHLANKLKLSYKHDDIKKIMNMLITNTIKNFESTVKEIDSEIKEFMSYYKQIYNTSGKLIKDKNTSYIYTYSLSSYTIREMIVNIANTVERLIEERFIEFFARFTDIYFLRRFLDKDYITNAIVYTGALHSNTYVHVLVNYFNFKVTDASYSKISDMNKLTGEIKKRSLIEIQELILPVHFDQCSNLTNFPKDFL